MARPHNLGLLMRTTAMVLATTVATLGLSSTAQASTTTASTTQASTTQASTTQAPAAQAATAEGGPGIGVQVGPYSNWPGPGWFWHTAWFNVNDCDYYGFVYVWYGYASARVCRPRFDNSGYDLWLRN